MHIVVFASYSCLHVKITSLVSTHVFSCLPMLYFYVILFICLYAWCVVYIPSEYWCAWHNIDVHVLLGLILTFTNLVDACRLYLHCLFHEFFFILTTFFVVLGVVGCSFITHSMICIIIVQYFGHSLFILMFPELCNLVVSVGSN